MKIPIFETKQTGPIVGTRERSFAGERRSPLSFPLAGRKYRGLQAVGSVIADIGRRMQQASEAQDLSDAMVKSTAGFAGIYRTLRDDPEMAEATPEEFEQRYGELSKELREQVSGQMKEPRAKERFSRQYDADDLRARLKVRDLARQRLVDRARASTDQQLQSLTDNLVDTGDIETINKGMAIIDGKVAAGILTAQEGQQLAQKFKVNAAVGYYERLIEDPKTAPIAYQELTADPEPKILQQVDERTKTQLIAKARQKAEVSIGDSYKNLVLAEMRQRFGQDYLSAAAYVEDPKHYKDLSFSARAALIGYFEGLETQRRQNEAYVRNQQAEKDRAQIYAHVINGDLGQAVTSAANSWALTPSEKVDFYNKVKKIPWETSGAVYADVVRKIHAGIIDEPEQINFFRGRGLSNQDADKLIGKLKAPLYKEVLDYGEHKFKLLYPAKDNLEEHVRYLGFVQQVDADISKQNAERAKKGLPPLTAGEARQIVDAYLDEAVEERRLWFDKTYRPVERWMKGKEPFNTETQTRPPIPAHERMRLSHIPADQIEKIADHLWQKGYKVNARNIGLFYENAKKHMQEPKQTGQPSGSGATGTW